jgi:glycosyltransferase involved in cell wall biosynthesis
MRWILAAGGDALTHIFLCSLMRERFAETYERSVRCRIVSNAAFVEPQDDRTNKDVERSQLTIGLLSNLTREKALTVFIELLTDARRSGLPLRGVLAGPIPDERDRQVMDDALQDLGGALEYRRPLFGASKNGFYRDIDVFVFPTTYVNEAQPAVIFEAKAAGNRVVSYDRGCISRQLNGDDLLVPSGKDFRSATLDWLMALSAEDREIIKRSAVQEEYRLVHDAARAGAAAVLIAS